MCVKAGFSQIQSQLLYVHTIGITMTGEFNGNNMTVADNILSNYSFITERGGEGLLARCLTGLGPTAGSNNSILGGWYFNGKKIPNGKCSSGAVTQYGADINDFVGIVNLLQCKTFTVTDEGVYTCSMMNSLVALQTVKLGIYLNGRSKFYKHLNT